MNKQSYLHLALNKEQQCVFVKVTAYHDKAAFNVLNKASIVTGQGRLTVYSFPILLKNRTTKPFEKQFLNGKLDFDLRFSDQAKQFSSTAQELAYKFNLAERE